MTHPSTVSPLTAHLGYWMRAVSNQVSHAFALKLEAKDVTVAEWVLMRRLYDQPEMAPSDLAAAVGLTRGAVSKLVDRLEAKALLVRTASAEDRRYQSVGLTIKGRALVPELAALADQNEEQFFGHMKPLERVALTSLLREIAHVGGLTKPPLK
ncbi:MAG: MarR family transcriptional regulator [Rhodospirillaceae bacterium]|nr:MarR family transcriptional regulator [Rhodospirillaceae bacterium]